MRAKEFIDSDVNEAGPLAGVLARALKRSGSSLQQAIQPTINTAAKTAATSFGTQAGTNLANKVIGQNSQDQKPEPPPKLPPTEIEPIISNTPNPNNIDIRLGGTGGPVASIDLKDPANKQFINQLGSIMPAKKPGDTSTQV